MKKIIILPACLLILLSVCGQNRKQVINFQSKTWGDQRTVKVALPLGYNDYPNRKFIVVFLFDAQSEEFFNYINATTDYLTTDGFISPVILVGISSMSRQYEFTPIPETDDGRKSFQRTGGADSMALYLKTEVMPLIQNKFRCQPFTVGIGHSLGGTFLTNAWINHPDLFNASVIISPNYYYDQEQLVRKFSGLGRYDRMKGRFIYIAYGNGDPMEEKFRPATEKMKVLLSQKNISGLKWQVNAMDNDSHGTTPHEGVFKGLIHLWRQFTLPFNESASWTSDTTRPLTARIKKYYEQQSSWAGIPLPLINDINGMGYNAFYMDRKKEAIEIFKWALLLYPDDINLYDSMGEIQQSGGNNKEAIKYYTKGLSVVEQQKSQLAPPTYQRYINGFRDRIKSVNNGNK